MKIGMARLNYAGGYLVVYDGWLKDVKQSPRKEAMTAEEAENFSRQVNEWWNTKLEETLSWVDDTDVTILRELNTKVKKSIEEFTTIAKTCRVGYWLEACLEDSQE